jgi:hypothetical protein
MCRASLHDMLFVNQPTNTISCLVEVLDETQCCCPLLTWQLLKLGALGFQVIPNIHNHLGVIFMY